MTAAITVFCSANARHIPRAFLHATKHFARLLVDNDYDLIWGGSDEKLMHVLASEVKKNGGKITGVSMKILQSTAFKGADRMIFAYNHQHRKQIMMKRGSAIVALPGGIGTLDEIITAIELKKHNLYTKPIILLNTENFYDEFIAFLKKLKKYNLIKSPLRDLVTIANTPEEVIRHLSKKIL